MSTQQIIDGWEHGHEPYSETHATRQATLDREFAKALRKLARFCKTSDKFIYHVQQSALTAHDDEAHLLDALMDWSYSTPENERRFKYVGWFGIAAVYWKEHNTVPR